jgi:hypothetical protein
MNSELPQTLQEAIEYFADADTTFNFMVKLRWPNGVSCPRCGEGNPRFISTRKIWECRKCKQRKQFSVKVGTIFEDSALPLNKWLTAVWMIVNAKNGISSCEIMRSLGVTQKTGWFMLQRIRLAMQTGSFEKFSGVVEADQTYIGGLARNMHASRNRKRGRGTSGLGKAIVIVMGLLERHSKKKPSRVKMKHAPNARRATVRGEVRRHVKAGSHAFTDALASYSGLNKDYVHQAIDHAECYVKDNVHTNGLENSWCLLKRCIKGTYVSVEPFHLFRYLDEEVFRFNNRQDNDGTRFLKAIGEVSRRRMTHRQLTGGDEPN